MNARVGVLVGVAVAAGLLVSGCADDADDVSDATADAGPDADVDLVPPAEELCESERPAEAGDLQVALAASMTAEFVAIELRAAGADPSAWFPPVDPSTPAARCEYNEGGIIGAGGCEGTVAFYVSPAVEPAPVPARLRGC